MVKGPNCLYSFVPETPISMEMHFIVEVFRSFRRTGLPRTCSSKVSQSGDQLERQCGQ
jgi:hypothetical protein